MNAKMIQRRRASSRDTIGAPGRADTALIHAGGCSCLGSDRGASVKTRYAAEEGCSCPEPTDGVRLGRSTVILLPPSLTILTQERGEAKTSQDVGQRAREQCDHPASHRPEDYVQEHPEAVAA